MSAITWGMSKGRRATVFCNHCREVFARDIPLVEAPGEKMKAEVVHHCTPGPRCQQGRNNTAP